LTDCILWQGKMHENGYGLVYDPEVQKHVRAHRYIMKPIPEGMIVMHTCDNRACVNPKHLKISTQSENLKDMYIKSRQGVRKFPKGSDHHFTTLTNEQVVEIKQRAKPGLFRKLAKEYGVSKTTIRNIHIGYTWSHVQGA